MTKPLNTAQDIGGSSAESQLTPTQQLEVQELDESPMSTLTDKLVIGVMVLFGIGALLHRFLHWPG